jgi:DNA mismatch repair ATPase MutS
MTNPLDIYKEQIIKHRSELKKLEKRGVMFGWLRFLSIALAFASLWLIWKNGSFILLPVTVLFIGLFLFILAKHLANNDTIENLQRLIHISETEIQVLDHHFTHLPDGTELKPENHEYANDLDIFGRASLFQYINRCTSEQGKKLFAGWLLDPASSEIIADRQEAIKELSQKFEWRQQLQSYGIAHSINIETERKIESWLLEDFQFLNKTHWKLLRFILPAISFALLTLHLIDIIPSAIFYPSIFLMLAISFGISKMIMPSFTKLNKVAPQLETLSDSVSWIEKGDSKSRLLGDLKSKYIDGSVLSSQTIKKLKKILDNTDIRLNPLVFIPLNTFLFWDLQQVVILENWKKENKEHIGDWFHSLAEIESLSSLANLSFNHPGWAYPTISKDHGTIITASLGHPLIPKEKLVTNSFSTGGNDGLNLITGSNMAGKSTFLRSVGVNIVLAMMGAPVCARSFTVSNMKVISSMRVSDNLEENTSTFYAELKKLKEVIEAVYRNERVFLLLDEILRGTNSADRHTGSKALIKQLMQHNAAGLIATHDLELAKLADEFPSKLHNYHFDVQVAGDELYFDYKLKRGVCTSMNASLLMKKIGIEL